MHRTEVYEIKPITRMNPNYHYFKDSKQLDKYIKEHSKNKKETTVRGTIFDPNGLLIPSEEKKITIYNIIPDMKMDIDFIMDQIKL